MEASIQARPWWATRSKVGLIFLAGTILGFLVNAFAPLLSDARISREQRKLEERIAESNQQLEVLNRLSLERTGSLSRQVEITRILFDHYFGKPAVEQTAVISYLRFQFPRDLSKKSLQAILNQTASRGVRPKITTSVASVQQVGVSKRDAAVKLERIGFVALIQGDLTKARTAFAAAYRAFPTYHNVDEITHGVLTGRRMATYSSASRDAQRAVVKQALSEILTTYSWGIPPDLRPRLEAALAST